MNKSLLIVSLMMVSAEVLGMHTDENSRKRRHSCVSLVNKQIWEINDSQEGIGEENPQIKELRDQLNKEKARNDKNEVDNQKAMNFLLDISHKSIERDSKISELESQLKESNEKNTKLTEKVQQSEECEKKVATNLFWEPLSQAKPNNEKRKLQEQLDKTKKKYKTQKKTNEKLNKKLREAPNPTVQELSKFIIELQRELKQKELSEAKLKKQVKFWESNKGKGNTEIRELKEEIEDLKSQLKESDKAFMDLEKDLTKTEAELAQKTEELEQLRNIVKDFAVKYNNSLNVKNSGFERP